MRKNPTSFDAIKSLKPKRPSTAARKGSQHSNTNTNSINQKPEWDSTVNDLNAYKLSRAQQLKRKASIMSKNRTMAREEWLRKQQSLRNGDTKVEREIIQKVKPVKKQKPQKKYVSYPFEIQRRLYNNQFDDQYIGGVGDDEYLCNQDEVNRQNGYYQCKNNSQKKIQYSASTNKIQQSLPRLPPKLRSNQAQIKFTPAQTNLPLRVQANSRVMKQESQDQQKNIIQISPGTNSNDLNQDRQIGKKQQETEQLSELQIFRRKYLGDTKQLQDKQPSQDPLKYLDISQNLKNIENLKSQLKPTDQVLNYPHVSSANDDFSLIPALKRQPIPNFFNNDILTSSNFNKIQEQNKFSYTPSGSNLYSQYIPEPKIDDNNYSNLPTTSVYEPKLMLNPSIQRQGESNLSKLRSTFDDNQESNMYDENINKPHQFMNISNKMQWLDGNEENPLRFQVKSSLNYPNFKQNSNWCQDDCPQEPRSYQIQQINQLSQNQKLPHLAGPPSTSLSIRSHMRVF